MRDLFNEIWNTIRRNKLRTALTGFAVAWGIFMLIVLLGAGNGLMNAFMRDAENISVNTMQVGGWRTSKPFKGYKSGRRIDLNTKDIRKTESEIFKDNIGDVAASTSVSNMIASYSGRTLTTSLVGVEPNYAPLNNIKILEGRFINLIDMDEDKKVTVISKKEAEHLLHNKSHYKNIIGKNIKINEMVFKVVGVFKDDERNMQEIFYVPFSTLRSIYSKGDYVDDITFSIKGLKNEKDGDEFEKKYRSIINVGHDAAPDDDTALWIWNRFTQNIQMNKGMRIITIALWVIGIFTLLSGIVGVSNIMLITVKERTHEIGIRKAIGASPWSVMKLIVSESIVITSFFGYIGMFLGLVACEIMDKTLGGVPTDIGPRQVTMFVDPTVGLDVAIEATLVLIIAGTIAGFFPSRKAAGIRPIEALREE